LRRRVTAPPCVSDLMQTAVARGSVAPDPLARQESPRATKAAHRWEPGPRPLSSQTRTVARVRPRTTRKGWKMAQIVATAGIDVCKDRLDVAVHPTGEQFSVSNNATAWREL